MNSIILNEEEFLNNLNDIKLYIEFIEQQKELFDNVKIYNNNLYEANINQMKETFRKVFNTPVTYNAIIISLYGCFESYIDKISNSLLDFWVNKVQKYDDLPEKVKTKHLKKSGDFLSNPQRFKNLEITEKEVLKKLCICLNGEENFQLNKELLLMHSGNLGIEQLTELFSDLGLKDCRQEILFNEKYIEYISQKHELNNEKAKKYIEDKKSTNNLFEELEQLIEQRNKVAHGWCVDTRLSYDILKGKIIPYIEMIGKVIYDIFEKQFIDILSKTGSLKKFDEVIAVYNNKILCVNIKDANLKCEEYIYALNKQNNYILLKIIGMQDNKQVIRSICGGNKKIGIEVDSPIKKNWSFYYT